MEPVKENCLPPEGISKGGLLEDSYVHMKCSLNSFKGGYIGKNIGG